MINHESVLVVSTLGINDLPTRKQRISLALCNNNRVIYLEPPSTKLARLFRKGLPTSGEIKQRGSLITIRLPDILPFGLKFSFLQKMNERILFRFLKKTFLLLDFSPTFLLTYLVDYPGLYRALNPIKQIYDCVDDHASYNGLRSPKFVNQLEKKVASDSFVCFATTKELVEKLLPFQPNTHLVTNGVDVDFFIQSQKVKPSSMQALKRPIIGYIGAIQEWFDVELIAWAAKERPNFQFVLVGPFKDSIVLKLNLPNIKLLGRKPYEEAPSYIHSFDVCLIPFIQNKLTLNISPLKFYEYCSLGKPTVSIPIKQMIPFLDLCYLYTTKESFLDSLDQALSEDKKIRERRIQLARENDWSAKLELMFEKIMAVKAG